MTQIRARIKNVGKEGFYNIALLPTIYHIALLMTCAHLVNFEDMNDVNIFLTKKDSNRKETEMKAKFVKLFRKLDVCILQIMKSGKKTLSCDFVTFAEKKKKIRVGADVYYIGGPHGISFTFACGRISYPCEYSLRAIERILNGGVAAHRATNVVKAKRMEPPPFGKPPLDLPFRVGAIAPLNFSYLHEDIPLIYADISSGEGASGSPLFNNRGEVIGMLLGGSRFSSFFIHHNALRSFIDEED